MDVLLEILKYILPAVIVFIGVYFILQNFFENEQQKLDRLARKDTTKQLIPIRLQASERIVLYLERIHLSNLVMRMPHNKETSAKELQKKMLATIRQEYEHNMVQQLYIPSNTWKMVIVAKEESIKVINTCAEKLAKDATAMDLSQFILKVMSQSKHSPTEVAIEAVKREVRYLF